MSSIVLVLLAFSVSSELEPEGSVIKRAVYA